MKVFASDFLEVLKGEEPLPADSWTWEPFNADMKVMYAGNNGTGTRTSTYAAEKDTETDFDRANEGK